MMNDQENMVTDAVSDTDQAQIDAFIKGVADQENLELPPELAGEPADEPKAAEQAEAAPQEENPVEDKTEAIDDESDKTVDYEQVIPMPDGREPMKLGEVKDRLVEYERREATIQDRESALNREQRVLREALEAMGGEIPPQVREHLEQRHDQWVAQEQALLFEQHPELKDKATRDTKNREMLAELGRHGFTPQEIAPILNTKLYNLVDEAIRNRRLVESARSAKPADVTRVATEKRSSKSNPLNDKALRERAKAGDEKAIEQLQIALFTQGL